VLTVPRVDAALHLSPRTVAWLADHPQARQFVGLVWDKLTELERAGQFPGATDHSPASCGTSSTSTFSAYSPAPAATANQPDKAATRSSLPDDLVQG
jgi:hypothetical protein